MTATRQDLPALSAADPDGFEDEENSVAAARLCALLFPRTRPRRIYPVRVRPARRMVRVAARSSRAGSWELTPRREVSGFPPHSPVAAEECVRRDSGSIDALISERRMSLTELADRWPEIA